jgi:hypothetical protein
MESIIHLHYRNRNQNTQMEKELARRRSQTWMRLTAQDTPDDATNACNGSTPTQK